MFTACRPQRADSVGRGPDELVNPLGFAPKVDPANVALVGIRDVDQAGARGKSGAETGVWALLG